MKAVMLDGMTPHIKYATSMPEDAVRTAQQLAADAGVPVGAWIATAIRREAIRQGTRSLYDALDADPDAGRDAARRLENNEMAADEARGGRTTP
jgi:hypothetical protein